MTPQSVLDSFDAYLRSFEVEFERDSESISLWRYLGSFGRVKVYLRTVEEQVCLCAILSEALPQLALGIQTKLNQSSSAIWAVDHQLGWSASFDPDELASDVALNAALCWLEREAFLAGCLIDQFLEFDRNYPLERVAGFGRVSEFDEQH